MPKEIIDGRKKRAIINKKSILDAAREIFIENGFSHNSMMDISRRAGVGYGTLYTHFTGRDDILKHLLDEIVDDFDQLVSRSYEPGSVPDVEKRIGEEISYVLKLARKHRSILKVAYQAVGQSESVEKYWDDLFNRYIEKSLHDYSYSLEKGFAKPGLNRNFVARAIVYLIRDFFWDVVMERDDDIESISRNLTSFFMYGTYYDKG